MCGPISRFDKFKTALDEGMDYDNVKIQEGFYLILKGLFMKVVIANRLSVYVGKIFASPTSFTGIALWLAAFFYSVQLYCDFAGYSSIAVGISRLFGMHYTENFKRPYFAHNIKEFWDRWHISLSSWLKDYIYIPLGGNRCSKLRQKFNVLAVFFVSGIWHGVGFNYIIWGLYHGVLNILVPKKKKDADKCGWLKILLNFALVTVGWIFFGTSSFTTAIQYIKSMFANLTVSSSAIQSALFPLTSDNTCVSFFLIVMAFIFALFIRELYEEKKDISVSKPASIAWQVFLLVSIFLFGEFGASAFIYANF